MAWQLFLVLFSVSALTILASAGKPQMTCGDAKRYSSMVAEKINECEYLKQDGIGCYTACVYRELGALEGNKLIYNGKKGDKFFEMLLPPAVGNVAIANYLQCQSKYISKYGEDQVTFDENCSQFLEYVTCVSDAVKQYNCTVLVPGFFI